ncbi:MAG: ATP-grasp domain-containing protein, partial [Elusimicrobiota bacterium]|nr:ATP-grasp domain-containing protein [Elusimicrobiota bacterium]
MNKQHFFIIGGGNLQYNFAQKAKDFGFSVHIFDYDDKCKCRTIADYFHLVSIDDKDKIFTIAKEYKPVGIHTVATEQGNISACFAGEKLGLNTNSYLTALNTTDKSKMKKIFNANNIPNAKYLEINSVSDINDINIKFPLVVKPSDRSAGRGVSLARSKKDFKAIVEFALNESFNKKVLIEQLITGKQFSVETISCGGRHYVAAFTEEYLLDGSDDFIETQQMIPARLSNEQKSRLKDLIMKTLNAFDIKYGACHIEVKLTQDGFKMIEIASRMGGWRDVMIKSAYGIDYNELLINSLLDKQPNFNHLDKNYALVKMIYTQQDYDFYLKIKKEKPQIIIQDEVKEYKNKTPKSLIDNQGFYYIQISKSEDIDYFIVGGGGGGCSP